MNSGRYTAIFEVAIAFGDLTQELRDKLKPLIPPHGSPLTSPYGVQTNHLVAALTHTLGGLRSQRMPTLADVPRSPFVPRTAQSPYSHVENSIPGELDRFRLTTLRATFDVEPFGSSNFDDDPSNDEWPSLSSASPLRTIILRTASTRVTKRSARDLLEDLPDPLLHPPQDTGPHRPLREVEPGSGMV